MKEKKGIVLNHKNTREKESMLERVFHSDNVVFRTINTIGYIWYIHLLWLVCSLPIVTMGASTSAMVYTFLKLRAQEGYVTKNFFQSFKENLKQSTILFLLYAVVGAILILDLIFGNQTVGEIGGVVRIGAWILIFPYGMSLLYVFAIQAKFVNNVKNTIAYSFLLSLRHIGLTIQMVLIVGAVIYLNCVYYLANYITLSMGIGLVGYFLSAYYQRIFAKYIPAQEGTEGSNESEQEQ